MYLLAQKSPSFDRVEQTMPDAMHSIAVQVKHFLKCIAGKAPEDGVAVRMEEKSLGRFKESWPTASAGTSKSGSSSNNSSSNNLKLYLSVICASIFTPIGWTNNITN